MAIRKLKDGRWICYYRRDGKQISEYFGRGAEGEAAAWKRDGELGLKKRRPRKKISYLGPTFSELAASYMKNKNFSENSAKLLKIRLDANIYPTFGNTRAIKITDQDLENYVRKRRRDGVKYSTIHREITDIKTILNWGVSRRPPLIKFNPVRDYKKPKPDYAVISPPTQEETKRILSAASPALKRAILISYYLGLRPGAVELLSLQWENVNWESKIIWVASAHQRGAVKRKVPISHKNFINLLVKWHKEDNGKGYIVQYRGRRLKKLQTPWRKAIERAGIKRRIRPYDLRHHFIIRALEKRTDMKVLSEVVGSRPETIMKVYQHVTSDIHQKTEAKIPALDIKE